MATALDIADTHTCPCTANGRTCNCDPCTCTTGSAEATDEHSCSCTADGGTCTCDPCTCATTA